MRCVTRVATPTNEAQLVAIAASVTAGQLPRALAAWVHRTSNDAELERHQHEQHDQVPDYDLTNHTIIEELQLRCAPCHRKRHAAQAA